VLYNPIEAKPEKRRLALSEETIGTYEPYLVNSTESLLPNTYNLPFIPAFKYGGRLDNMTISGNATHQSGDRISNLFAHNGLSKVLQSKTYAAHVNISNSRPALFSEATFAGSGSFVGALVSDIYRSWTHLKF